MIIYKNIKTKFYSLPFLYFIIFTAFSILFWFYKIPLGLMDDFKNIALVDNITASPIKTFIEWNSERIFKRGMIQPFYLLQVLFQYFVFQFFGSLSIYIVNNFLVLIIFYIFVVGLDIFHEKFEHAFALLIFLTYPFVFDLFVHPSLQEKYIFMLFGFSLLLLKSKSNRTWLLFIIGLSIPLIKLQGSIFIFPIFFLSKFFNNAKSKLLLSGILVGVLAQGYVIFFIESDYFIFEPSISKLINNLLNPVNISFVLLSLVFILVTKSYKLRNFEENLYFGMFFAGLGLVFIYSNWYIAGYLLASYSFFVSIYITKIFFTILNYPIKILTFLSLVLFLISSILFFIPRLERWSDLGLLYEYIGANQIGNIKYCSSEGVYWLNSIQNNNTFEHVNNISEIEEFEYYLLIDKFQCEQFVNLKALNKCILHKENSLKGYDSVYIVKVLCDK